MKTVSRRTFLMATLATGLEGFATAHAAGFPEERVTLVVPYAPGGNGDFTARTFAQPFSKALGQSVIVENKSGGGGAIGADYVARAKPNGYTLLACAKGVFSITPNLVKVPYTMDDFKPIGFISAAPMVLVVKKSSNIKTLQDLIKTAKAHPEKITIGMGAIGSDNDIALLRLQLATKSSFTPVAYPGDGPMLVDLMGGHIDAAVDQLTSSKPFLDAGRTRALAVLGTTTVPLLPSTPTIASIGDQPFDSTTYIGLLAPRGISDSTFAILRSALKKALQDTHMQQAFTKVGGSVYLGKVGEFEKLVNDESNFVKQMIKEGKIKKGT